MTYLQNPSIDIFGLRIDEPVSTITDLIVAAVGILGFIRTSSSSNEKHVSCYRYFFLLTGISTLFSALFGHAFGYQFGSGAKIPGWLLAILGVGFAQFAVLFSTKEIVGPWLFPRLLWLNLIEVTGAVILTLGFQSFIVIEAHSAFGLLFMVTILEAINYSRTKSRLSKNMIWGVALAVVAVICHITKIAFSKWFNHLDISHVFLALSLYVMYKGVTFHQTHKKTSPV